ncbi:unnamed protein product [Rangifer tarandus platyrhynchus]|uniref:Uncharacterized protein n=2 Tax=Rangifer tarandus platyrhynchus TaxID=3082113 RepID=A0ABN8ZWY9_RANTA|nr:unnamed protein product [Rangifer tarandus platyrhynchus]
MPSAEKVTHSLTAMYYPFLFSYPTAKGLLLSHPTFAPPGFPGGSVVKNLPADAEMRAKSLQSHPTLHDPMDCSPPGSSAHGTLQARTLEWVAMPLLQGIFPTQRSNSHLLRLLHCRRILYH